MNYEKKYKQLYTLINDLYPYMSEYCKEKVEGFFPELMESEYERIRRRIYNYINVTLDDNESAEKERWLAWLEKMSEQNLANPAKTCKEEEDWSEEDERLCKCLINDQEKALDDVRNDKYGHSEIISDLKEMYRERIAWLESLKERLVVK